MHIILSRPMCIFISCRIVRSYLLHYGYQDTLNSFDMESENSALQNPTSQENGIYEHGYAYALNHRKILRQVPGGKT